MEQINQNFNVLQTYLNNRIGGKIGERFNIDNQKIQKVITLATVVIPLVCLTIFFSGALTATSCFLFKNVVPLLSGAFSLVFLGLLSGAGYYSHDIVDAARGLGNQGTQVVNQFDNARQGTAQDIQNARAEVIRDIGRVQNFFNNHPKLKFAAYVGLFTTTAVAAGLGLMIIGSICRSAVDLTKRGARHTRDFSIATYNFSKDAAIFFNEKAVQPLMEYANKLRESSDNLPITSPTAA